MFGDSLQAERLTKSRRGELRSPVLHMPVKIGVPKAPSPRELDRPKAETEGVNAPAYHPVCLSRQHCADGNVCGRLIASPTGAKVNRES